MRNVIIAAAVAGALGTVAATSAVAAPTAAQAAGGVSLVIAGSSAVRNALQTAIAADICGGAGNMSTFAANSTSNNPDFRAYSCQAAPGKPFAGSIVTIYDRSEGGSVVGVGPIVNKTVSIGHLNLGANGNCDQNTGTQNCTVNGAIGPNGANGLVNDSWLPANAIVNSPVDLGISDLVPGAFVNNNWGTDYTFIGPQPTASTLNNLNHSLLFEQTFGYVANVSGVLGSGAKTLDLTQETLADIFAGNYTDWSNVPAASGTGTVASSSSPIVLCNREPGSGTRTGTAIFLEGQSGCSPASKNLATSGTCAPNNPSNNCFTTSDELACVTAAAGSIGYVTIDNYSKISGTVVPVTISNPGVAPSTTLSALGQYAYIFEASANKNANIGANALTLANFVITELQALGTTAQSAQVSAIPFGVPGIPSGNTATVNPLHTSGIVPVSAFSKSGVPCSRPVEFN